MNFQQLRSVREAARRGFNLTEVANALFTSQPGVSRQIRELEEELGIDIFERSGKRLTGLTDPGNTHPDTLCLTARCTAFSNCFSGCPYSTTAKCPGAYRRMGTVR